MVVHSMEEAGTSRWAAWWLLFLSRLLSFGAIFGLALYNVIFEPYFNTTHIYNFCAALSFFLLVVCTALNEKGSNNTHFATVTLLLHGIFSEFSFYTFASVILIAASHGSTFYGPVLILQLIPFVLYLFDILAMQSRMRLRYRCAFIAWIISFVADIVFAVATYGDLVQFGWGYIALAALILLLLSYFVIAITRIRWPCLREGDSQT